MPIEDYTNFEDLRKNEIDEQRENQLESFNLQVKIDNNCEELITQKCRYDRKFATYSEFGEITGEKLNVVKNNLAVIDIDIAFDEIDKYFNQRDADNIIGEIEENLIEIAANNNAIVVLTASYSYHIYCNGESIRNDPLLSNKKSSYIKACEYKKSFECENGSNIDIKLFDVDIFVPTEFGANCGVMLPGSRVINKKGEYSCYTIIKDKDNIDEKIRSLYEVWDDVQELYGLIGLQSIWSDEKELQTSYRNKKLNESEIVKNGMSKEMFDLIIKGFEGVEIHNWAAPIEKEITLYPLICGLNACVNGEIDELDVEIGIEFIKKNAKLTLSAELNFDRIMFSTDDISSTPFSLLKMIRIHNPDYYKKNLSRLIAKMHSERNTNQKDIMITIDMLRTIISGYKNLDIYADFEFVSDEITIGKLLKSLYSCESESIKREFIKSFELDIRNYCNFTNAANRQLRETADSIETGHSPSYLIEMLKIHNPIFYNNEIEPIFYLKNNGIDLNDPFTIERMQEKNYVNNGNIMWTEIFNDISRSVVWVESEHSAFVKIMRASNNSYRLIRCSIDQFKSRLDQVVIRAKNVEKVKSFTLKELLYDKRFRDISIDYSYAFHKRGVCFYSSSEFVLSLFTGFTFPERNEVDMCKICLFLSHIKNIIANGDEILYKYILSWIAFIVQNPGKKTNTCLMILGEEGTGKTMFTTVICKLFGNYSLPNIASIDDVVGQFNAVTENKMLVVLNELNAAENTANKKAIHNKLKTLITEDINIINKKGIDQYEAENVSNYIICSNEFNPLIISENDRRYVVTEVSNSAKKNTTYFRNLFNSFDSEFYINLYNYFRLFDIRNFDLTEIPMTKKKQSMINMGLDSLKYYIKRNVDKYKSPHFTAVQAYEDYVYFYRNERNVFIHGQKSFYENMKKICEIRQKKIPGEIAPKRLYVLTNEALKKIYTEDDEI